MKKKTPENNPSSLSKDVKVMSLLEQVAKELGMTEFVLFGENEMGMVTYTSVPMNRYQLRDCTAGILHNLDLVLDQVEEVQYGVAFNLEGVH
jgi:hypothetical protein